MRQYREYQIGEKMTHLGTFDWIIDWFIENSMNDPSLVSLAETDMEESSSKHVIDKY